MSTQGQQGKTNVARLESLLGQLAQVMEEANTHMEQPLDAGYWDGDDWIDAETADDRAFLVVDNLVGELVAACLGMCDTPAMTLKDFAEYVQVMVRAQQTNQQHDLSPSTYKVLDFMARNQDLADEEPDTPPAAAQLARLQWMMQLPQEDYLAALEERTDDGQPKIVWAIHPDNWDFERNCPKAQANGGTNGHRNGTGNGAA